ncbi:MAG: SPOR domain-containing protein, partial [Pseudomonadota bacterium]
FLRAESGPMKVQPDDPGGLKMGEVDAAVTRMLGEDAAEGAEASIALAPADEAPAAEDLPAARLERSVEVVSLGAPAETPALDAAAEAPPAPGPLDGRAIDAAVEQALQDAPAAPRLVDATARAPSISPVAATRPLRAASVAAPAAAQLASAEPALERRPDPAPAPAPAPASSNGLVAGAQAVQLGAFNSEAIALDQWSRHRRRNGDLLSGFAHAVTTVQSGGRTLYRLRVGPVASRARAQELCAALEGRGDACIPVRVR